jgi:hypothetical protein
MPAIIEKKLQGIVRITENGYYYFNVPKNTGTALPNALDNSALEEVYIIVENIAEPEIEIYLPKISDFNLAWNPKIYVLCKTVGGGDFYVKLNSYSSETYTDWLNQEGLTQTNILGSTLFVHILDNNYWLVK